jgi:flagella basal body P-ring formation protein FlgA
MDKYGNMIMKKFQHSLEKMIYKIFIISFISSFWCGHAGYSNEISKSLENRIRRQVEHYILEHIEADSLDLHVQVSASLDFRINPSDVKDIRIDWQKGSEDLAGRVVIPVSLRVKRNVYYTTYATALIRLFDRVCVANSSLHQHHLLSRRDLKRELQDVTGLQSPSFKRIEKLFGRRTKQTVEKGGIITEDMIEDPPLIREGERVRIIFVYENQKVMTRGYAIKDGWLGDQILVRNPKNRSELVGLVVKSKEVEVRL